MPPKNQARSPHQGGSYLVLLSRRPQKSSDQRLVADGSHMQTVATAAPLHPLPRPASQHCHSPRWIRFSPIRRDIPSSMAGPSQSHIKQDRDTDDDAKNTIHATYNHSHSRPLPPYLGMVMNETEAPPVQQKFHQSMDEHGRFEDACSTFGSQARSILECKARSEHFFASHPPTPLPTNSHCRLRKRPCPFSRHALEWRP